MAHEKSICETCFENGDASGAETAHFTFKTDNHLDCYGIPEVKRTAINLPQWIFKV